MAFFDDGNGRYFPIANIDRMTTGRKDPGSDRYIHGRIYLKDSDEYGIEVPNSTIDDIVKAAATIIPAQPGFTLLRYYPQPGEPDHPYIEELPIVGWRNMGAEGLLPVVLEDDFGTKTRTAIRLPTGRMHDPYNGAWEDQPSWQASVKEDLDRKREETEATKKAKDA